MAFSASALVLMASAGPHRMYYYSTSDTMAQVAASTYINNPDDAQALKSGDVIHVFASDGNALFQWSSGGTGDIALKMVSTAWGQDNGVIGTASAALSFGITEIGTGTATAFALPTPVVGGIVTVTNAGTATGKTVAVSSSGVTIGGGLTTITLGAGGIAVSLLAVSTTRWRVVSGGGLVS